MSEDAKKDSHFIFLLKSYVRLGLSWFGIIKSAMALSLKLKS